MSRAVGPSRRAFMGAAALSLLAPAAARAQTRPKIRVLELAIDLAAQAYYAQALGLFAKNGLDVEITTTANGGTSAAGIAGGAADIGISNPVQIAAAVTRGLPFTIIAGGGLYTSAAASTALCVARDSPLRTAKDCEGKTIALSALNDQAAVAVKNWLTINGADWHKVEYIEIPFPTMGPALAAGRVAVAMIPEPALTVALHTTARLFAKPFDAVAPEFAIEVWFSTQSWVAAHEDERRRFASAIYAAARWANDHHDDSAAILAQVSKLDPAVVRSMTRAIDATTLTPEMLQPPIDVAYKYGLLTRPVSAADLIAT